MRTESKRVAAIDLTPERVANLRGPLRATILQNLKNVNCPDYEPVDQQLKKMAKDDTAACIM
jgi:hypothetical protein